MTDAKSRAINELLRSENGKWLEIASAVHQAYPDVETQIVREFSELIRTRLKTSLQDCIRDQWDEWHKRPKGRGGARYARVAYYSLKSWDAWETSICLEVDRWAGSWYMGVRSSGPKEGRKQLEEHLETKGGKGPERTEWWPYREWVADRKYWGGSVPQMNEEVQNRGSALSDCIVGRFKKLVHLFEPIINEFHAQ